MLTKLTWWFCLDGSNRYRASVDNDHYVIVYHREWGSGDHWKVTHRRGRKVRQLGVTKTAEQAMALAQADFENREEEKICDAIVSAA